MTDYLRFILNSGNFYDPVSPLVLQLLQAMGSSKLIDLSSGGGGAIEQIQKICSKNIQCSCLLCSLIFSLTYLAMNLFSIKLMAKSAIAHRL